MDESATAAQEVGLALIGTGYMGKCHALAFAAVAGVFGRRPRPRLEVVADLDADAAARAARDHGFRAHTTEWRDAVADPAVSLVAIAAPNGLHRPIALAALERSEPHDIEVSGNVDVARFQIQGDARGDVDIEADGPAEDCVGVLFREGGGVRHGMRVIQLGQ